MTQQAIGASLPVDLTAPGAPRLRASCLSYSEILAQSVSVIAPSTVPAAMLGLIFARAGNATWLSFLLGTVGLVLVGLNINQFARRSASPGSLYSYIVQGLGPTAGVVGGLGLLFGYMLTGMSTLCGFALIANVLLQQFLGIQLPILVLFGVGICGSFYVAFRDIQLSAKMMLLFEGLALLCVVVLGAIIWSSKGFAIDGAQLTLEGATPGGTLVGVVLVVFGFSGFESSTSLGDEAKNPLKTIPRSVLQSVVLAGVFFMATSYVVVLGFEGNGGALSVSEAPLHGLASSLGWGGLGTAINIGILLSFFSCTLAAINSSARLLFSMARHGLIPDALGQAHVQNQTPHIAVALTAFVTFGIPSAVYVAGVSAFDCQAYFATLCSFGFIVVYILTCVAAPAYLASIRRRAASAAGSQGALRTSADTPPRGVDVSNDTISMSRAIACSVGGVAFMSLPLIGTIGIPGSDLLPPPEGGLALLATFAAYISAGLGWLFVQRMRRPKLISHMRHAVENLDLQS